MSPNETRLVRNFINEGKKIKRHQYTVIDDATRIRALKIYEKHNQDNAINFINYVTNKFNPVNSIGI